MIKLSVIRKSFAYIYFPCKHIFLHSLKTFPYKKIAGLFLYHIDSIKKKKFTLMKCMLAMLPEQNKIDLLQPLASLSCV